MQLEWIGSFQQQQKNCNSFLSWLFWFFFFQLSEKPLMKKMNETKSF